jgi:hypothetical protein
METITEQRHEHLTEEEKKILAQIRSVATTLYEKGDLNKPTVEFLREHFYKDPTLALAYFDCCSTDPCVVIYSMMNYNWMLINQLYGIIIVVQQILAWQYSMTNYNRMLINQSHGIAFQT